MTISDKPVVERPPVFHAHMFETGNTLEELNEWATGLFSPLYSDSNPAFSMDGEGNLTANQGGRFTLPIPVGFYILFSPVGSIMVADPRAFEAGYEDA